MDTAASARVRTAAVADGARRATELASQCLEVLPEDDQTVRPNIEAVSALIKSVAKDATATALEAQKTSSRQAAVALDVSNTENKLKQAEAALQNLPDVTSPVAFDAVAKATAALAEAGVAVQGTNAAITSAKKRFSIGQTRILGGLILIAIPAVAISLWTIIEKPRTGLFWSVLFGAAVMTTALFTLLVLGRENGLLRPLIGKDNRVSTSYTQFGIWTVAVGFAIAFLLGRVLWDDQNLDTVLDSDRLDEYLLLIGGPFAAAVLAKLTVAWKTEAGTLQKTIAPDASASQIISNDEGQGDLVDSQYLIFNFIALAYFLVRLANDGTLPEIPTVLLGLTSASAATYVANKVAEKMHQ